MPCTDGLCSITQPRYTRWAIGNAMISFPEAVALDDVLDLLEKGQIEPAPPPELPHFVVQMQGAKEIAQQLRSFKSNH